MDCPEIRDILDAYALKATSKEESDTIEVHVADCVRCWDDLTKAQRTSALLALSSPIIEPPADVEIKIMAEARRDLAGIRSERKPALLERVRVGWSTAAAGLGAVSVAALAFAGILQAQVNDLRNENNTLEASMLEANQDLARSESEIAAVTQTTASLINIVGDSTTTVEMLPRGQDANDSMSISYTWNDDHRSGAVRCKEVPPAPEGHSYQIWFSAGGSRYPAASFTPEDGDCFVPIEVPQDWREPVGVGVSIEDPEAVVDVPQDGWLAYAYLSAD